MHTIRFGRRLSLPSTIAIKHQLRKAMAADQVKKAEARAELTDIPQIDVGRAAAVPLARPAYQVLVVNADHDSGDSVHGPNS